MANNLLVFLIDANLAAAVATLVVLGFRRLARTLAGARIAYALWLIVPAAMLATLAPPRILKLPAAAPIASVPVYATADFAAANGPKMVKATLSADRTLHLSQILLTVWLTGAGASLALLVIGQRRALLQFGSITADPKDPRLLRASNASVGPAVVGVFRPRLIVPTDFESRFDATERDLILAHERMHLTSGHAHLNAVTALAQTLNWFNPLIHVAARCARTDQELACDAAVVSRFPGERHTYAQALLKTQIAVAPLPLGAAWPPSSSARLLERIEMLALKTPGRSRLFAGGAVVAGLTVGAGVFAWSAEPPVTEFATPARITLAPTQFLAKPTSQRLAEAAPALIRPSADAGDATQASRAALPLAPTTPSASESPTLAATSTSLEVVAQRLAEHPAPRQVAALIVESQLATASAPIAIAQNELQRAPAAARPSNADGVKLMIYVDWPIKRLFLGCLSCAPADPTSIWNPASPYGWTNPRGVWGRQGFRDSVCDTHLTYPAPKVFDERWTFYYRLSADSLSRASICSLVMSRQGCSAVRALCDGKPVPAVAPSEWTDVTLPRS